MDVDINAIPPQEWTVEQVGVWLGTIGFKDRVKAFAIQDIDGAALLSLTNADMQELGLKIGERKRLGAELQKLDPRFSLKGKSGSGANYGSTAAYAPTSGTRVTTSTNIGSSLDSGEPLMEMQFDYKNYPKTFMVSIPLYSYGYALPFLPLIYWLSRKYVRSQKLQLTPTRLVIQRGFCNIERKSIPLDKVQDIDIRLGCVDRCFKQCKVGISLMGGTAENPAGVIMLGPTNADEFRQAFLDARNHMVLQRMNGYGGP